MIGIQACYYLAQFGLSSNQSSNIVHADLFLPILERSRLWLIQEGEPLGQIP